MQLYRKEGNSIEAAWLSDKINATGSLFFNPQRTFQTGSLEERCKAAIRYFEERLNYIYTRRHMFLYLENVPFRLTLLKGEITDNNIGNITVITSADQDSPLPKDFENGLYKTIKLYR